MFCSPMSGNVKAWKPVAVHRPASPPRRSISCWSEATSAACVGSLAPVMQRIRALTAPGWAGCAVVSTPWNSPPNVTGAPLRASSRTDWPPKQTRSRHPIAVDIGQRAHSLETRRALCAHEVGVFLQPHEVPALCAPGELIPPTRFGRQPGSADSVPGRLRFSGHGIRFRSADADWPRLAACWIVRFGRSDVDHNDLRLGRHPRSPARVLPGSFSIFGSSADSVDVAQEIRCVGNATAADRHFGTVTEVILVAHVGAVGIASRGAGGTPSPRR